MTLDVEQTAYVQGDTLNAEHFEWRLTRLGCGPDVRTIGA